MKYKTIFLTLAGIFLLGGICDKMPERQWERGHFEPIGGKPYKLPSGLEVRQIIGYDDEIATSFLPLALTVLNNTQQRIAVTMPEGLVFSPLNHEYQYMMLLQSFSFSVPADQDTLILLPTYCANEDLDEPDDESFYEINIQVWERELCELFTLLRDKHLDYEDAVELAQEALFEITDGEGLTDETREALKNLP
jgi:hypothetical protein